MLQTQVLSIGQVNKPCIGLTQENLIENSVQNHLHFILNYNGPYCYKLKILEWVKRVNLVLG